jgi:hypothetical protein
MKNASFFAFGRGNRKTEQKGGAGGRQFGLMRNLG